jgi:hypothetical protein
MRGRAGFFDFDERLKELSAKGDHLERLNALVDVALFRPDLVRAVPRSDGSKGGRPPFDHVFMFKVLVLQASYSLAGERTAFLIKDRLSFMRFLGLGLCDPVPDANTIWTFREALTRADRGQAGHRGAVCPLRCRPAPGGVPGHERADHRCVHRGGPQARNTDEEKQAIKEGRIPEGWSDKPAKLAQKDRDARWTVKWSKGRVHA